LIGFFYGKVRPIDIAFGPNHSRYISKWNRCSGKSKVGKGSKVDKTILLSNESPQFR